MIVINNYINENSHFIQFHNMYVVVALKLLLCS